jgi:sporulation protein YlmC with PRC-barrel domain
LFQNGAFSVSNFFETKTATNKLKVMTKKFLKITVICAACSMAASVWAQSQSQDQQSNDSSANRSWSTKHLSATGRNNEKSVRASKLTGAQVNDSAGQNVGTIQDVIINANSGRIDFALLSLNSSGSSSSSYNSSTSTSESTTTSRNSSGKLVPVPWSLLRASASSSQYSSSSEQPTFTLSVDRNKLNGAPTVDTSDLSQSEWQQRIYSYYGAEPQSMGASESPQGEIKGEGARHMEESTPERQQQPTP